MISVVVATHNRAPLLAPLMAGLEAQQTSQPFEVVLVDDASDDRTWDELGRLEASSSFPVQRLRLDQNSGAATARNVGWRAARAPMIAFTDDDCVPTAGWIDALVGGLIDHDLVQGPTLPNPTQTERFGPFARTIVVVAENGYYETCNMGYRRKALEAAGGFDEGFRWPYGEDCDLAWRVKAAGGTSTFVQEALVHHEVWPSDYRAYLRDKVRREGIARALKKHPDMRARRGIFQNGAHPTAVAAAAAGITLALTRRPSTFAAAGLFGALYAWNCRNYNRGPGPGRRAGWIYLVPMHLVADLYEVAVLARASARHRTLVL